MRQMNVTIVVLIGALLVPVIGAAQTGRSAVIAIAAPRDPLAAESLTTSITRFSFVAYGDTRNSHDGLVPQEVHGQVITSMINRIRAAAGGPDPIRFVLQSGDAVANGNDIQQLNVSYVPLINRITAETNTPFFFAVGNHDVGTSADLANPGRQTGLANVLAANANLWPPDGSARRLAEYPTYAIGYGNTFVVVFDAQIAGDPVQFEWVKSQLAGLDRARYVHVVMVAHEPTFSSASHGGARVESSTLILRNLWMPVFRQYHVQLLIAGHEHEFEHFVEHYQDASGVHRFDELVTGGGGAPLYAYTAEPDLTQYLLGGAAQHVSVEHLVRPSYDTLKIPHHYLIIHVDGPDLTVEIVGVGLGAGYAPYNGSAMLKLADPLRKP